MNQRFASPPDYWLNAGRVDSIDEKVEYVNPLFLFDENRQDGCSDHRGDPHLRALLKVLRPGAERPNV